MIKNRVYKGNLSSMKSILLTSVQFLCIGWILYTNPWLSDHWILKMLQFGGLALGIWAIIVMSKSKLNITPVPRDGAFLITSGPYRLLRHPMYTSVILILFPILYGNYGVSNILVFSILLLNLLLKLRYEENLLKKKFPDYAHMKSSTWRLIPWIY